MTKTNQLRLALLSATALFTATTANAQVADSWTVDGEVIVTATNTSDTTTLDPVTPGVVLGVEAAAIADGFRNSISGSAVGASASSAFTSVNNSGTGGEATLLLQGVTVSAGNQSAVLNTNDIIESATISAGGANSISLAAVGSSASVSGTTTVTSVGGGDTSELAFTYGAGDLIVSSGDGLDGSVEVEQGSTIGGNDATVTLTLATGFNAPTIEAGFGNSISVAGVGSSSSASFSATVGAGSDLEGATFTVASGTISATNSENGAVGVGLGDAGIAAPTIGDTGNANSISAAAVGSSASFSLASGTYDGGIITDFTTEIGDLQVDSYNAGAVTLSADGADPAAATVINEASIGVGNSNSISASAVGASGSVSYSNTIFSGDGGAAGGAVGIGAIVVNSTNVATVDNATDLTTSGALAGGSRNSISIAGVGASASQSVSITDNAGAGVTAVATTIGGDITLTSLNTGVVTVSGGLQLPEIAGGFSNSVSAAAVGASASQSVSRTVLLQQ